MGEDRIERDTEIAATLDRVWALVTTPGFWVSGSTELPAAGAAAGMAVVVNHPEYGDFPVRVQNVRPKSAVSYRWTHAFPGEALREDNSTLIEFTLTERAGSVLLQVVESGFSQLRGTEESRATAFEANSSGWEEVLAGLKVRAEKLAA